MLRGRKVPTKRGSPGRWGVGIPLVVLILAFALFPVSERGGADRLFAAEADSLLNSRTLSCSICEKMVRGLPEDEFSDDPHGFACRECHHPHTKKTAEGWRNTCTSSGCHLRAWTETVFHRLDPEIFLECSNCHEAHTWSLDGFDCQGCHGPPAYEIVTTLNEKSKKFSHQRHGTVECRECHGSLVKHGVAGVRSAEKCMACHHGSSPVAECTACHQPKETAGLREIAMTLQLGVWEAPRKKRLPFDHARHKGVDCAECHGTEASTANVDCASCHERHHQAFESQCWACHGEPGEGIHPRKVHEGGCTGSGCHSQKTFEEVAWTRNLCQACHRDRFDHEPGEDCADCHMPLD